MTRDVGRNAPCPCGSGKKFKKCCLEAGGGPASPSFGAAERAGVLARVREFASRPELAEDRRRAETLFLGECAGNHPHARTAHAIEPPETREAFETWFALDVRLRRDRTPVGLFLERHGSRLPRAEREYLERMRDTDLRPYQVIDLGPEGKTRLIDLWTGATVWLREAPHGPRLLRWDLLAARVVCGAEGDLVIDGLPYRYPVRTRDTLLRALRRAHARMGSPVRAPEVVRFFKNVAMIFHHFSLAVVALGVAPPPGAALVPPLVSSRALFDVRDRMAIVRALARYPDLEHAGDGTWTWLMDPLLFGRALGRVVLEGERLVLETWAEGALEQGRELLHRLAGDAIEFRGVEHDGVQLPLGPRVSFPSGQAARSQHAAVTHPVTPRRETLGSGERA